MTADQIQIWKEQANEFKVVIACYSAVTVYWMLKYGANFKWGTDNSASSFVLSLLAAFQAYRNYRFHYVLLAILPEPDLSYNFYGAIIAAIAMHFETAGYWKHLFNYSKRLFSQYGKYRKDNIDSKIL